MMTIDDVSLLAFFDGTLPPLEHSRVARQVGTSPELSERMSRLHTSDLAYATAFDDQALPPLPERLVANVDALIHAHLAKQSAQRVVQEAIQATSSASDQHEGPDSINDDATLIADATNVRRLPTRRSATSRAAPVWLAAAFVAGAFCWGIVMHATTLPGSHAPSMVATAADTSHMSPWIAAAAGYQALYSRETVARIEPDMPVTAATVSDIRHDDDIDMSIPDLSKQGLAFKRIQRLRWHDKPLVQIVYLPAHGAPVALCVLKEQRDDATPAVASVDALDVVSWRRGGVGYALLGERGNVDLNALGQQLYNGNATSLSRNDPGVRTDVWTDAS